MGVARIVLDILLGNNSLPAAEKARRVAARETKRLAKRQQAALTRSGQAPGYRAKAGTRTARKGPTSAGATPATKGGVAPGSEVVPYTGAVTVVLPSGRVARHDWQPNRPADLSPLYAALDTEALSKIFSDVKGGVIEDPSARLLDHISPTRAEESLSYYMLNDRYYTTLPILQFAPGSFNTNNWPEILGTKAGRTSTLSIHYWHTSIAVALKGLGDQIAKKNLKLEELRSQNAHNEVQINDVERDISVLRSQLRRVITHEETLFRVSAYLRVGADSLVELNKAVKRVRRLGAPREIVFDAALGKQRDAYISTMPFSSDPADRTHAMVATAAAQLFPFITRKHQETDKDGNAVGILYGIHRYNRTPVMISPWNSNNTVQITTVLGQPGSGKSYWLRCHLGRLAMTGVQIIAIDPINDFGKWFAQNEGQIISIYPDSPYHINPLKVTIERRRNSDGTITEEAENLDVKINQRLKPLFQLLLGDEYKDMADGLIGHGLRAFYDRYGTDEHLMSDLVETLRELNVRNDEGLSAGSIEERRRLIDNIKLKLVDGEFRSYFANKTNVELNNRKIVFDLSRSEGGLQQAFACYLAVTMAVNLARQSHDRKIILIDEIHRLFGTSEASEGITKTLEDLLRTHRHWNTAVTFATQFVKDDKANAAQEALLASTNTWVLMGATESMLKRAAAQVGETANLDVILQLLRAAEARKLGKVKGSRYAIVFRQEVPIPIISVGLGFEDEEDDLESGTRRLVADIE